MVRVAARPALVIAFALVIGQLPGASLGSSPQVRDVGKAAGLPRRMHSWDVQPVDIDRDGWTDLIISHHHERATVYRNEHAGGESLGFTPMATLDDTVHHWNDVHGCAAADVNQDGLTDIICLTGAEQGTSSKWNQMWIQDPAWTFTNKVDDWNVADIWGRGRHPAFLDLNGDRYPDLFIGNDEPRQDDHTSPNRLYADRRTHFAQVWMGITKEVGAQCVQVLDVNHDGRDDLLVCGNQGLKLYVRSGARFIDERASYGLTTDLVRTAAFVDLNGDGRKDFVGVEARRLIVQFRKPGLHFGGIGYQHALKVGHGLAVGDVSGHHGPDLYVVQGCQGDVNVPDVLLLNGGDGLHWTSERLPSPVAGCGDVAAPIDFDRDGRMDFVVLNGGFVRFSDIDIGPDQLLTMGSWGA